VARTATVSSKKVKTVKSEIISKLKTSIRGRVILPEDQDYNEARKVYNGMIDKHPRIIVRCANAADVRLAVAFARENDVPVAVRGGGHNGAGLATCDDGMVIDFTNMKGVRFDPSASTIRAEPGCSQVDVNHLGHTFGCAVPAGVVGLTGIAGLTLGGGTGYLTRKYGLTIDNLLAADMVLADGSFVTASAEEHPDLFWAIRGGGGNFGIVTSFLYQAHPVPQVIGGPMFWDLSDAREVLEWFGEFMPGASEDLYGFFAFLRPQPADPFPVDLHGKVLCGIIWCYSGPPERAEAAFKPIREFRKPILEVVGPMPYIAMQSLFDDLVPSGLQWYWKGHFVNRPTGEAIDRHLEFGSQVPTLLSTMHLYPIDGAAARVGRDETAFSYRDAPLSMVICGIDPDPANADLITKWTRDYWAATEPYSLGGTYVNFMMEEGADRVRAAYRGNFDRLVEIKTKYDPDNFFARNQNIQPRPSGVKAASSQKPA
jgi:FAD binding domain/Berberine and berberine like